MTKIKKLFGTLLATCLFFVASLFVAAGVNAAPRLYLDPSTKTAVVGNDFQVTVKIDVGTTGIFGADAVINYSTNDVTVKSVTPGNFFSDNITPGQSAGQIILRGSFLSTLTGIGTGSGTFATITFSAAKAAGTGAITFNCSSSDIIEAANGNNIFTTCSAVNGSVITFSTGVTPSPTPAPGTPPGPTNGPTNACGGTCGSVYNCNANLFCYQGYCRNPDCPGSSTCGCPTVTPSPKPTQRPISKGGKPTPPVITLAKSTPFPSLSPVFIPSPVATAAPSSAVKPVYIWGALIAAAIIVILIGISALRRKSPPKFTPPTGGVPPTFPTNPPTVM